MLWKCLGGRDISIQLMDTEHLRGMYVVEVPGAGALNPERHLYEGTYCVVEGRGTAKSGREDSRKKIGIQEI